MNRMHALIGCLSMKYARNLFKADVKTSSRGTKGEKGSGLGLIFCQDIIKAHQVLIELILLFPPARS